MYRYVQFTPLQPKYHTAAIMSLCTSCRGINIHSIVPYCDPDTDDVRASYMLKPTFNALVDSAQKCVLCQLFLRAIELENHDGNFPHAFKDHADSNVWLYGGWQMFYDLTTPKGLSYITVNVKHMKSAVVSLAAHAGKLQYA
jgi:hypothetical protein